MMNWILKTALKLVSYETMVEIIAAALAYILEYARKNAYAGGWEKAKSTVKQIKNWTTLLDEVYEDDTLTEEEEKKIQEAIANCTIAGTIYELITGKKRARVAKTKKATFRKNAGGKRISSKQR